MSDSHPQVWPHEGLEVAPAEKEAKQDYTPRHLRGEEISPMTPSTANVYAPQGPQGRRRQTVWGIPHRIFWALVSVLLFVVFAAIGIGAGVGVSLRNSGGSNASTSPSTSASTSASFTSGSAPYATATPSSGAPTCPGGNGTFFQNQGSGFLLLCGRDYSGVGVAFDFESWETNSFSDCVRRCALDERCTGAGWGPYPDVLKCWLKSQLNLSAPTWNPTWSFAVMLNR